MTISTQVKIVMELYRKPNQTAKQLSDTLDKAESTIFRNLDQLYRGGIIEISHIITGKASPPQRVFKLTEGKPE